MLHLLLALRNRLLTVISIGPLLALVACGGSAAPSSTPTTGVAAREPKLASPLPGSYAALGASETYGVGATPHTRGYAYLVSRALHAKRFVDVGIPGTTLIGGYDLELSHALAVRPSLCTLFFGLNDFRGGVTEAAFLQNLRDLSATLRRTRAQVLIVGLPDLSKVPAVARLHIGGVGAIVSSWNSGMRRVARQTGAHVVDLRRYNAELASHPEYISSDGLHPSNAGHARLAQVVTAEIRRDALWPSR